MTPLRTSSAMPLGGKARIAIERVVEGFVDPLRRITSGWIDLLLQATVFGRRSAAKRVGGARDQGATFLPDAGSGARRARRVDRVEARADRGIDAASARTGIGRIVDVPLTRVIGRAIRSLDARQVRLEGHLAVVLIAVE